MDLEGLLVTRPHILLAKLERPEVELSEDSRLLTLRLENLFDCCLAPALITSGLRAVTGRSYTVSGGNRSTWKMIRSIV